MTIKFHISFAIFCNGEILIFREDLIVVGFFELSLFHLYLRDNTLVIIYAGKADLLDLVSRLMSANGQEDLFHGCNTHTIVRQSKFS